VLARRILIIAPHPDDEVLGVGGTIARLAAEGSEVFVLLVTHATHPPFPEALIAAGRREAGEAQEILGVQEMIQLDVPAAAVDSLAHRDLNERIGTVLEEIRPGMVFLPFLGDMHLDHQLIFQSSMVACRPHGRPSPTILAYETLSETNWNAPYLTPGFLPNWFVDISDHFETKMRALRTYESQLRDFPHERSVQAVEALARLRGSHVGVPAAEAFVLIRAVV
jgi:LmbE family N-acetylglucosaminyl deacetylase